MRQFLLIGLILLSMASCLAEAEGTDALWYDYADSQAGYGQAIAQLNRAPTDLSGEPELGSNSEPGWLVLLRMKDASKRLELSGFVPAIAVSGPDGRYTLQYPSRQEASDAAIRLSAMEDVAYAELDQSIAACADTESAPSFHSWGAEAMGFAGYLTMTVEHGTASAEVAVLDSGTFLHPDIRLKVGALGYDYVDGDADPTNDLFGHGTHVTGIVADCTQSAPVSIYPIRVLDANGKGRISNLINAVYEAANRGADVINLSLTSFSQSAALDEAVGAAVESGAVVVLAAGNNACDTAEVCPAHLDLPGVIVVASAEGTVEGWSRASYSNWGESVDLYAFGTDISSCSRSGGYVTESGTSMAAPHVAAACALMRALDPGTSPAAAESRLTSVSAGGLLLMTPLVPRSMGFFLSELLLDMDDHLPLPQYASPVSADAPIGYQSADEAVVGIDNGLLAPKGVGTTRVRAQCFGMEPVEFTVTVTAADCRSAELPNGLRTIGREAMCDNDELQHVILPPGVVSIGSRAFADCAALSTIYVTSVADDIAPDALDGSPKAVFLIPVELEACMMQNGWQYLVR